MKCFDCKKTWALEQGEARAGVSCAALVGALREDIARKLDEARLYDGDYYTGYRDGLVMALNAIDGAKESAPTDQGQVSRPENQPTNENE